MSNPSPFEVFNPYRASKCFEREGNQTEQSPCRSLSKLGTIATIILGSEIHGYRKNYWNCSGDAIAVISGRQMPVDVAIVGIVDSMTVARD